MISGVVSKAKKTLSTMKSNEKTESKSQTLSNGSAKGTSMAAGPLGNEQSSSVYDFDTIEDGSAKMSYSAYRSHSVSPEKQAAISVSESTSTGHISSGKKQLLPAKKKVISKKFGVKGSVIPAGRKTTEGAAKWKEGSETDSGAKASPILPRKEPTTNVRSYQH